MDIGMAEIASKKRLFPSLRTEPRFAFRRFDVAGTDVATFPYVEVWRNIKRRARCRTFVAFHREHIPVPLADDEHQSGMMGFRRYFACA